MHGEGADAAQSALSEPLHVAISGRDVPDYDMVELLINAELSLECKVIYMTCSIYCCMYHLLLNSLKNTCVNLRRPIVNKLSA